MSTADWNFQASSGVDGVPALSNSDSKPKTETDLKPHVPSTPRRFHRVKTVRVQQGLSLRSAARRMGMTVLEAESLENEESNMLLSTLYQWQEALDVPITDLLVEEGDELSEPIERRARLVRVMKTAAAINEAAENSSIERMSRMLVEQLIEIMPELAEVSPWHAVGQRRSGDEVGRLAEQPIPEETFLSGGSW